MAQKTDSQELSYRMSCQVETDDRKPLVSTKNIPDKGGTSSTTAACFNFINSIIGSGIIGLPYSMNRAGLPLGILLLLMVACITGTVWSSDEHYYCGVSLVVVGDYVFLMLIPKDYLELLFTYGDYSIILMIKGGNLSGAWSYQSLVQNTFGFSGYLILSVLQFLYPFIELSVRQASSVWSSGPSLVCDASPLTMISYNIITGDTLTKVFQTIPSVGPDHLLAERHFVILVSTLLFTLPLSLYRDIAKLGKVSLLSMVLTLAVLSVVTIKAATLGPQIPPVENAWAFANINAIQAIGVMSFAFICHHNSFLIYSSLKEPTLTTWSRVTHISVGSAALISLLFAAAGYATFTGYTQGDIFENYCKSDDLATFGRFCFGISIITTFPLECFVTREVVSNVFFNGELGKIAHVVVTVVIIAVCTVISLTYDCLGIVLELNGVLSATPLIFIVPSACYLKLSTGRWFRGHSLTSCVVLLLGVFVMITGVVMTVLYPQDCSHGAEMFYCFGNSSSALNATPSATEQLLNITQNESLF